MRLIVGGGALVLALAPLAGCSGDGGAEAASGLRESRPSASAEPTRLRGGVTRSPSRPAPDASPKAQRSRASSPAGPPPVKVTLVRSGGFAGVDQQVVVAKTGRWTYQARGGEDKQGRLTSAQTRRLRGWVADPEFADEAGGPGPGDTGCRDGYRYRLAAGGVSVTAEGCAGGFKDRPISAKIVNLLTDATPM